MYMTERHSLPVVKLSSGTVVNMNYVTAIHENRVFFIGENPKWALNLSNEERGELIEHLFRRK